MTTLTESTLAGNIAAQMERTRGEDRRQLRLRIARTEQQLADLRRQESEWDESVLTLDAPLISQAERDALLLDGAAVGEAMDPYDSDVALVDRAHAAALVCNKCGRASMEAGVCPFCYPPEDPEPFETP